MTNLNIQQGQTPENVSPEIIDKLHKLALQSEDTNGPSVTLSGNITPSAAYEDSVTYLRSKFPNLTINISADDCYIRFENDLIKNIVLTNTGNTLGITKREASLLTDANALFGPNNLPSGISKEDITSLNDIKQLGIKVVSFSDWITSNYPNLETIDLSNITTIGQACFSDCTKLQIEVNCPNLTSIGTMAFRNSGITKIIDLGRITSFSDYQYRGCFQSCKNLTEVTLPPTLSVLGSYGFASCENLQKLNYSPESIIHIGNWCFSGLKNLDDGKWVAYFPNVTFVGSGVFNSTNMYSLYLPVLQSPNKMSSGNKGSGFLGYSGGTGYSLYATIPIVYFKQLNKIYPGTFYTCNIQKIVINNTTPPVWHNSENSSGVEYTEDTAPNSSYIASKATIFGYSNIGQDVTNGGIIGGIYVPDGTISTYTSAPGWNTIPASYFHEISEINQVSTKEEWNALSDADKLNTLIQEYM